MISKETVTRVLFEFLKGNAVWEYNNNEERSNLMFYSQGATDFAESIIDEIEKECGRND